MIHKTYLSSRIINQKKGCHMKLILILLVTSLSQASHYENKVITDCRVNRMVDYTYFEEGLSTYEYPDVEVRISPVGQYSVSVGSHLPYEASEGDKIQIQVQKQVKTTFQVLKKEGDLVILEIEWRRTMAKLTVKVKEQDSQRPKTIAYGMCDRGLL